MAPWAAVVGRVAVDLYPSEINTPLAEVETFKKWLGGFAANVSVGLARLGVAVSVVSRVGDDGHGTFCRSALEKEEVSTRFLATDSELRTALAFCEAWPPDHFPITFYRTPTCPDWQLTHDDVDWMTLMGADLIFLSGTGLAQSPSREFHLAIADEYQGVLVFDLDWRPQLWKDHRDYAVLSRLVAPKATWIVGNQSEFAAAFPTTRDAAALRSDYQIHCVVEKLGPEGARAYTEKGVEEVSGLEVNVVNGLGAGDAFAAGLGYGILSGLPLEETIRLASAAGAAVVEEMACSDAMPRLEKVQAKAGLRSASRDENSNLPSLQTLRPNGGNQG